MIGIHEIAQPVRSVGVAGKSLHQFGLGEAQTLNRVGGKKTVLDTEKRSFRLFRDAAGDQCEIGGFLNVARKHHPPAAVRDAHNIVMACMNIQPL